MMERTMRAKRIYSLGQYQNLEIEDTIVGIPQERVFDEHFIGLVNNLQLLNLERKVNRYYQLREKYREMDPNEAFALIEDEIAATKAELFSYLNQAKES